MQVKLLRFLESGEVRRVGDNEPFHVDVSIVCATNRELQQMVTEGLFREDLFFRVNTFEIYLPPLRERLDDIPSLAMHLIARHLKRDSISPDMLPPETVKLLQAHHWSGNVRELANVLEHSVILSDGVTIRPEDLPRSINRDVAAAVGAPPDSPTISMVAQSPDLQQRTKNAARNGRIHDSSRTGQVPGDKPKARKSWALP